MLKKSDDDDVCYYIGERPKLEGKTENTSVWTKERKGMIAEVLMATPCTKSLGGASVGHKHGEDEGRMLCWKFATVSWSGLGSGRPSMLMLVRSVQSAAVLATMRPVLLFGVLKKAARR